MSNHLKVHDGTESQVTESLCVRACERVGVSLVRKKLSDEILHRNDKLLFMNNTRTSETVNALLSPLNTDRKTHTH